MSLKTRVRISTTVKTELYEGLKDLSDQSRINITKLLDEAIEDLLKKHSVEIKLPEDKK